MRRVFPNHLGFSVAMWVSAAAKKGPERPRSRTSLERRNPRRNPGPAPPAAKARENSTSFPVFSQERGKTAAREEPFAAAAPSFDAAEIGRDREQSGRRRRRRKSFDDLLAKPQHLRFPKASIAFGGAMRWSFRRRGVKGMRERIRRENNKIEDLILS